MEYNDVKQYLTGCPELAPLDEAAAAALFWRGQEQTFGLGDVVYAEGEKLDHTFCLLLSGWLVVEAEQDPKKADPLTYATMGFRNLSRLAKEAGFTVVN